MNVVDSSAWLAWFMARKNADAFADVIENTENLVVPSVTLTEVFKFTFRHLGEAEALVHMAQMMEGTVVPLDGQLAIDAAELGLRHSLPLADSIIYATALRFDAVLWTQDADFEGLSGVKYFPG
jgi:predicted nucleic acid-binding protein